jgi:hypothetical protein
MKEDSDRAARCHKFLVQLAERGESSEVLRS